MRWRSEDFSTLYAVSTTEDNSNLGSCSHYFYQTQVSATDPSNTEYNGTGGGMADVTNCRRDWVNTPT